MELWIRSQDKDSLIKVEKIELIYDYMCSEDIQLIHIETDKGRIGSYSTKERALEVLDEIQNILNLKDMYKYDRELVLKSWKNVDEKQVKIVRQQMSVYEMPKE